MSRKTPAELLAWISDSLSAGQTVYVSTHTRHTKVTPSVAAQFAAAGYPLFRATDRSLYMAVGRRYDCIDYCTITVR